MTEIFTQSFLVFCTAPPVLSQFTVIYPVGGHCTVPDFLVHQFFKTVPECFGIVFFSGILFEHLSLIDDLLEAVS